MSFKLSIFIVVIAIAAALTMGCANESEPTAPPFRVSFGEKSTCFKNIPETFQRYFENKISEGELRGFWACARSAIQTFDELVESPDKDSFTPQQLNRFLTKMFLKNEPLPEGLVVSLMDLKTAWFGGNNITLTKSELRQLQVWFAEFENVMVMLQPYLSVYMADRESVSYVDLIKAEQVLTMATSRIGALPLSQGKAVETKSILRFLTELERYLSTGQEQSSPMKKWADLLPLVVSAKKLIFGTPEEVIAVNDWQSLLVIGAQGFMLFRHADYGVVQGSIETAEWAQSMEHVLNRVNTLVMPVFERRKGKPIVEAEWQNLFVQVEKSQLVDMKADQLMQIYLTFQSIIKAPSTTDNDLHSEDFRNLVSQINAWKEVHKKITAGKSLDKAIAYEAFLMNLEAINQEMQLDSHGEWVMPAASKSLDLRSRLHLNWRAAVLSKLLKKYGDSKGWTMDQLKPLQKGLSTLFEEKYLVKVFREANLFTLVADGDEILSPSEALQYLGLVLSGMSSSSRIQSVSADLNVDSVQKAVWKNKDEVFAHTPLLLSYLKDEKTWEKVNQLLMTTVKDQGSWKTPWTSWELSQSQILLLYLEGFMKRFDLNNDQVIDYDESQVAYKVFAPLLGQLLGKIGVGPAELPAFFSFLIKHGDTPFTLYGGAVLYNHWKWNPQEWKTIRSDRRMLLSILATLSKL